MLTVLSLILPTRFSYMRSKEVQAWEKVTKRPNAVKSPEVPTVKPVPERKRPRNKKRGILKFAPFYQIEINVMV